MEMLEVSDDLDCFSETHLIGEDATVTLVPTRRKPVHTIDLVVTELIFVLVSMRLGVIIQLVPKLEERLLPLLAAGTRCGIGDFGIGGSKAPPVPANLVARFFGVLSLEDGTEILERKLERGGCIFGLGPHPDNFVRLGIDLLHLGLGKLDRFRCCLLRLLACGFLGELGLPLLPGLLLFLLLFGFELLCGWVRVVIVIERISLTVDHGHGKNQLRTFT
mmetsp:Transcript_2225/g.6483  ORF Transcript_2225/g.6483 Transcript_2225/m.6483 type:complete len:219 (+) Transcript_2225:3943-4599(+)